MPPPDTTDVVLLDETVTLPGGPRLALRRAVAGPPPAGRPARPDAGAGEGDRLPFLLVHGLASNARLWDAVSRRLAAAGHEVVAVDLRGHGASEAPAQGYSTEVAADDLAALLPELGWGDRRPVVAGQSWGGNVVLTLAARHGGVAAVALLDGGWLRLRERFPDAEECWRVLAPPSFEGVTVQSLRARLQAAMGSWPGDAPRAMLAGFVELPDGTVRARLSREHHREIVHSLWAGDPRALYAEVGVPMLAVAAVAADGDDVKRAAVEELVAAAPHAQARWYVGAHHDLHAQQPDRVAADLLALAQAAGHVAETP